MGSQDLHHIWHFVHCLHNSCHHNCFRDRGFDVLSACCRRPWMVVEVISLWWINWLVYLLPLLLLLLPKVRYVWFPPNIILLWLHGLHLLWHFPNAWDNWFPCFLVLCSSYIWLYQVWVATSLSGAPSSFCTINSVVWSNRCRKALRIWIVHLPSGAGFFRYLSFALPRLCFFSCDGKDFLVKRD